MNKTIKYFLTMMELLLAIILCFFTSCTHDAEQEKTSNDYPVAGIWCAETSMFEPYPNGQGGDTFTIKIWFDFREDGTIKNRRTMSLNGHALKDELSDWFILNLTWTVKENVITLSSGKKFIIIDDEFNDTYGSNGPILHYKKMSNEHSDIVDAL